MRYFVLIFVFFNFQFSYSQLEGPEPPPGTNCSGPQPPPPSGGPCEMCNYLMEWDSFTCEYVEGSLYEECVEANCPPLVPVSSNRSLLFVAAILLGNYFINSKHKKRPLEN